MSPRILESLLDAQGISGTDPILSLLNGPYVTYGQRTLQIPEGSQRLAVFVALGRGAVDRRHAAGTLWPDADDKRAAGNLRSALWRLNRKGVDILAADNQKLWLVPYATVDVHLLMAWSSRILRGRPEPRDLCLSLADTVSLELLPGWYEEWVLVERERLRQRLLHALEALARILVERGRTAEAVEIATAAVGAEPLRESAQRVLLEAHMAEKNVAEARRAYCMYRELVDRELGVDVSSDLQDIIGDRRVSRVPPARRPFPNRPSTLRATTNLASTDSSAFQDDTHPRTREATAKRLLS